MPSIAAPILPEYKAMQRSVQRVRKQLAPTVENENPLQRFVLSFELKVANTGEDFVFYDSGIETKKGLEPLYMNDLQFWQQIRVMEMLLSSRNLRKIKVEHLNAEFLVELILVNCPPIHYSNKKLSIL